PMVTLGRELKRRGHRASVISTLDAQDEVLRNGLEFIAVGAQEYPLGSLKRFTDVQGKLTGTRAVRFIIKDMAKTAYMHARDLPDAVTGNGIDALVVDQIQPLGATVALRYDLPFVNLCSLLPLNTDPGVPPWNMAWPYQDSNQAKVKNKIAARVRHQMERPVARADNRTRVAWGLPTITINADQSFSELAQIAQIPEFFDFPRTQAPECFHHTGPLHDFDRADPVPFPWERLDGRPLIYGTMGTLQNRLKGVFRTIAEACAGLDAQLVISLGQRGAPIPTDFPGNPIVVDYAPQLDILKRASLFVGHGGQNTVLQSLAFGLPMVLMPAATDQPGVAARAKHIGVGEFIPVRRVTVRKLRAAIETVQSNPAYRQNAQTYQNTIRRMDAVGRAADIVEQAFRTREPVLRTTTT
ncbi:MAG TPA: nucleotide disphospho-sugar-binding domain-containing protein, partial [Actinocrinis sp.]|uniref:glycosyltransferase n=1 Tax=Actinocrinis sp. TaxID=1920516 RepID=UPI002DDD73CD